MTDAKRPAHRPKEFFPDMEKVYSLCKLNCTDSEIAAFFEVSLSTVERERKSNPEFNEAIERGKSYGKLSLRRKQVELATEGAGNATMLIWLGKQYMGQKDKTEVVADVVNRIMPMPTAASAEDWEEQAEKQGQ